MKKLLAALLAAVFLFSFAACTPTADNSSAIDTTAAQDGGYVLSDGVKEGSVVDGVMTDISSRDAVLQKTVAPWLDTCVLYEVNIRQYTEEGTFAAFEAHLDRLRAMGVNTLWLMPIHPISEKERKGTLGSYYAVRDYRDVNPEFGTMEDFRHLLQAAHDKGFRVILDWVANHTGRDNPWIEEHDDWFVHTKSGEIESPYDWTDTAKLDYDNYEMRAEMIHCMQYWIEDVGVDGFRCDHAIGVPATFWNAAVYKLKSVKPDIMMLAESSATESLTTYAFDCCYNEVLYGKATGIKTGIGTSAIREGIALDGKYVNGSFPMNYLDNHDMNTYNGTLEDKYGDAYEALLALTFVTPGLPLIYTSNEEGYNHEIAFFEKDAVVWDDAPKYAELIAALAKLKAENPALASSNPEVTFLEADNPDVFVFSRTSGGNTVIYIGNLLDKELTDIGVDLGIASAACALHGDGAALTTDGAEMKNGDFEKRTYQPYEFFVLTVN